MVRFQTETCDPPLNPIATLNLVKTPIAGGASKRWMLVLIAMIAAIPFLLAWLYASHPEMIARRSNYGTLIVPAKPLSYAELLVAGESPAARLQEAKGRWILLQVAGPAAGCSQPCAASLQLSRQIRLLLNKDIARVRRMVLMPAGGAALPAEVMRDDTELLMAQAHPAVVEQLATAIGRPLEDGMLILVDPFANAMMWYPPGFDPYGVLRDLKHLLRSSQIG